MIKIFSFILALMGFLLPMHGGITVFLPENFRWWKEILIIFLFLLLVFVFMNLFKNITSPSKNSGTPLNLRGDKIVKKVIHILKKNIFGILFLLWGGILISIAPEFKMAVIAFRYLGIGIFVFLIVNILLKTLKVKQKKVLHIFCTYFMLGNIISILFGYWVKFGGGLNFVQNFYSKIISSWVPGQNIPIYHQTSDGFIRMQGLGSGPVEFGHLVLIALFMVLFMRIKFLKFYLFRFAVIFLFIGAIYQSGSRSAILGAGIFLGGYYLRRIFCHPEVRRILKVFGKDSSQAQNDSKSLLRNKKGRIFGEKGRTDRFTLTKNISDIILIFSKIILVLIFGLMGLKYLVVKTNLINYLEKNNLEMSVNSFQEKFMRMGDLEHFTRPIEAFKKGQENILWGNLGELGPAKRASNLEKINNDKALIAENVFVDIFAQMGIFGILFYLLFFLSLGVRFYKKRKYKFILFLGAFLMLMNLATLFDMTPLSLSFFLFLALI